MTLIHTPPLARSLTQDDGAVVVAWADGRRSVFHHFWLRDNCACATCGPHDSGARLQRLLDIPAEIAPASASLEAGTLRIVWNDPHAHVSIYEGTWLRDHAYSPESLRQVRRHPKTLWDATLPQWPGVEWDDVLNSEQARCDLHSHVEEYGFVLVRGLGTDLDTIETLANQTGYIRETHYGRFFDLITRAKPVIVADLAGPLLPHTDEAYRGVPTGINMFHCIRPSEDGGGDTQLVDAHHVAALLAAQDPEAYDLLTSTPVRHERRIEGQSIVADVPPILLDSNGEVLEVRLNERTMSSLDVPAENMLPTYAALRQILSIAYAPENRIGYNLKAGEALLTDNLRVLHGRTGYNGDRHLRQTQVMRDEFFAKGRALRERLRPQPADQAQAPQATSIDLDSQAGTQSRDQVSR
ncbi:TauD/TfdA family dioxygenase [Kineosporia sp. NBRC 101731]|uniref:TauD/TfdA family dioxygenase n=1 Tax=Kineosporia sp. NBRC 101731 TaxID=3032199 RepID=UPI0024A0E996|nr:TauD/TfdA family dioxygenase [Kineosporia sp. NBRC 101731]GLY33450.1 gamma-butyrobetaine hydroxylase [Kineosporia sp. NBRC 101731]